MEKNKALKKISQHFSISEEELINALKPVTKKRKSRKIEKKLPEKSINTSKKNKDEKSKNQSLSAKKFIFLEEDYDYLIKKMNKIIVEINRLGQEIGESCDESETFHDNFDYEELGRQKEMWTQYLKKVEKTKDNAEIIKPNTANNIVSIGKKFRVESSSGKVIEKIIGSYLTFTKDRISYLSPLARKIIGKKVGDSFVNEIENETYVIKKIT
ncbi:MAG TPA: GreA/GreB family elongation factor [Patescibacteria group bacterium]|nr:GreA/GreB family elongation factor [Patescibacteria group bacterium]